MTRENGSRQQTVRRHNRALVLRAVLNEGVRSRTELAERLGLTRMALKSLVIRKCVPITAFTEIVADHPRL